MQSSQCFPTPTWLLWPFYSCPTFHVAWMQKSSFARPNFVWLVRKRLLCRLPVSYHIGLAFLLVSYWRSNCVPNCEIYKLVLPHGGHVICKQRTSRRKVVVIVCVFSKIIFEWGKGSLKQECELVISFGAPGENVPHTKNIVLHILWT